MTRRISRWWRSAAPGRCTASDLGRALGCDTVLVPRYPGLLCALGLLATDVQYDYARTAAPARARLRPRRHGGDLAGARSAGGRGPRRARALPRSAAAWCARPTCAMPSRFRADAGCAGGASRCGRGGAARRSLPRHARAALYVCRTEHSPVEIVTLRVRAIGLVDKIALRRDRERKRHECRARTASARCRLDGAGRPTFRSTGATRCRPAIASQGPRLSISSTPRRFIPPGARSARSTASATSSCAGLPRMSARRNLDTVTLELDQGLAAIDAPSKWRR